MSSNLIKSYTTARDQAEVRVIDSNELIEEKLERIRHLLEGTPQMAMVQQGNTEGFLGGLEADAIDTLTEDADESGDRDIASNVIKAQGRVEEPVYEGPSKEELIAQANEEIAAMKEEAVHQIEQEKEAARKEGYESGYSQGMEQAALEAETQKEELNRKKEELFAEYENKMNELEPEFIKTLTGIYEKIFEVDLSAHQEIIVALLRNTMKKLDGCKNFLIHVSKEDFSFVNAHKADLLSASSQEGTVIDVIEDMTIREKECTIETVNGIFDCGLGTELEELKKKLILLSYEGLKEG